MRDVTPATFRTAPSKTAGTHVTVPRLPIGRPLTHGRGIYRGYLDLGGPARITIGADNHGEIDFSSLRAGLDLGYGPSTVFFT